MWLKIVEAFATLAPYFVGIMIVWFAASFAKY